MTDQRPLFELVTPPQADMVLLTIEEARRQCVVDDSDDDALLARYIKTATNYLEAENGILGRALFTQTWKVSLPCVPSESVIELPYPPIQSIDAVTYMDANGELQTFADTNYGMHKARSKSYIALNPSATWPAATGLWPFHIEFTAGYGDAATNIPEEIVSAAALLVGHLYENREASTDLAQKAVPMGFDALISGFRVAETMIA